MEGEESETTSWSPVQRERLFTCRNISDISGKKRKQGTVTGNASSIQLPEDKQVDEAIEDSGTGKDAEEPSNKRVKPVSKGTGLASLMGPVKSTSLKRIGQSISRSISFKTEAHPFPAAPLRPRVKNTPSTKRKNNLLWSDTVESISEELSAKEIKRQEVRRAGITALQETRDLGCPALSVSQHYICKDVADSLKCVLMSHGYKSARELLTRERSPGENVSFKDCVQITLRPAAMLIFCSHNTHFNHLHRCRRDHDLDTLLDRKMAFFWGKFLSKN